MIFVHDKIYATVWKVDEKEKYIDLQATTSEKDMDGNYINSGWFPRLIGHAFNTLKGKLSKGTRIIITKSKFTNERYTAKDGTVKSSFKFLVLEADLAEPLNTAQQEQPAPAAETTPSNNAPVANVGDDCPW